MYYYYFVTIESRFDFYGNIVARSNLLYQQKRYFPVWYAGEYAYVGKEYTDASPPSGIFVSPGDGVTLSNTRLKSLHSLFEKWHQAIFHTWKWSIVCLLIFICSLVKLIQSKGKHEGAFLLFVLAASVFGSSLVVCLVEIALERYSYPTQFIYYLSVALVPLLFSESVVSPNRGSQKPSQAQEIKASPNMEALIPQSRPIPEKENTLRVPGRKRPFLVIGLGLLSIAVFLAAFAMYHKRFSSTTPSWQRDTLIGIRPEIGFAYIAPTNHPELSHHQRPSPAIVLEDGFPLPGPPNSIHEDIRKIGKGRFSFWHDYVYFSTSDNSDPNANGRTYQIYYPDRVRD